MYSIFKFRSCPWEDVVYELNRSQPSDDHRHDLASLFRSLGPDNKTLKEFPEAHFRMYPLAWTFTFLSMGLVLINLCYKHVHPPVICQQELESPTHGFIHWKLQEDLGTSEAVFVCMCPLACFGFVKRFLQSRKNMGNAPGKNAHKLFNQTCLLSFLTCLEFSLRPKETWGSNEEHSFIFIGKLH